MTISVDLNGAAGGTDTSTAFTEQNTVTLFSSATISTTGGDAGNTVDTITITLSGATPTESLSLNAAATAVATAENITVSYNSGTGVLTLSGSNETTSQWQAILQGIQYERHSDRAKDGNGRRDQYRRQHLHGEDRHDQRHRGQRRAGGDHHTDQLQRDRADQPRPEE